IREVAKSLACDQQLVEDLTGGEIAHHALRAGVTEGTGKRTAHLAGNAQRAAALFRNVDGFDLDRAASAARRETKQPLARAVRRNLLFHDLWTGNGKVLGER